MPTLWKSSQDCLNRQTAAGASLTGTQISTGIGGGSTWVPSHNGNTLLFCKGASLLTGGTAGLLAVHLVDDPVGVWYLIDLVPGAGVFTAEFDLVGDSTHGTTVTLDGNLYIYPGLYAQANNSTLP